jgi:hypothetical protein
VAEIHATGLGPFYALKRCRLFNVGTYYIKDSPCASFNPAMLVNYYVIIMFTTTPIFSSSYSNALCGLIICFEVVVLLDKHILYLRPEFSSHG